MTPPSAWQIVSSDERDERKQRELEDLFKQAGNPYDAQIADVQERIKATQAELEQEAEQQRLAAAASEFETQANQLIAGAWGSSEPAAPQQAPFMSAGGVGEDPDRISTPLPAINPPTMSAQTPVAPAYRGSVEASPTPFDPVTAPPAAPAAEPAPWSLFPQTPTTSVESGATPFGGPAATGQVTPPVAEAPGVHQQGGQEDGHADQRKEQVRENVLEHDAIIPGSTATFKPEDEDIGMFWRDAGTGARKGLERTVNEAGERKDMAIQDFQDAKGQGLEGADELARGAGNTALSVLSPFNVVGNVASEASKEVARDGGRRVLTPEQEDRSELLGAGIEAVTPLGIAGNLSDAARLASQGKRIRPALIRGASAIGGAVGAGKAASEGASPTEMVTAGIRGADAAGGLTQLGTAGVSKVLPGHVQDTLVRATEDAVDFAGGVGRRLKQMERGGYAPPEASQAIAGLGRTSDAVDEFGRTEEHVAAGEKLPIEELTRRVEKAPSDQIMGFHPTAPGGAKAQEYDAKMAVQMDAGKVEFDVDPETGERLPYTWKSGKKQYKINPLAGTPRTEGANALPDWLAQRKGVDPGTKRTAPTQWEFFKGMARDYEEFRNFYPEFGTFFRQMATREDGTFDEGIFNELNAMWAATAAQRAPHVNLHQAVRVMLVGRDLRTRLGRLPTAGELQQAVTGGKGSAGGRLNEGTKIANKNDPNKPGGGNQAALYINKEGPLHENPDWALPKEGGMMTPEDFQKIVGVWEDGDLTFEGNFKLTAFNLVSADAALNRMSPFSVIDTHMFRLFGYKNPQDAGGEPTASRYIQTMVYDLAKELGWEPHQVQSALWYGAKNEISPVGSKAVPITRDYTMPATGRQVRADAGPVEEGTLPHSLEFNSPLLERFEDEVKGPLTEAAGRTEAVYRPGVKKPAFELNRARDEAANIYAENRGSNASFKASPEDLEKAGYDPATGQLALLGAGTPDAIPHQVVIHPDGTASIQFYTDDATRAGTRAAEVGRAIGADEFSQVTPRPEGGESAVVQVDKADGAPWSEIELAAARRRGLTFTLSPDQVSLVVREGDPTAIKEQLRGIDVTVSRTPAEASVVRLGADREAPYGMPSAEAAGIVAGGSPGARRPSGQGAAPADGVAVSPPERLGTGHWRGSDYYELEAKGPNGERIGFVGYSVLGDKARVTVVRVDDDAMGGGVGTRLYEAMRDHLAQTGVARVEGEVIDDRALGLWKKVLGEPVSQRGRNVVSEITSSGIVDPAFTTAQRLDVPDAFGGRIPGFGEFSRWLVGSADGRAWAARNMDAATGGDGLLARSELGIARAGAAAGGIAGATTEDEDGETTITDRVRRALYGAIGGSLSARNARRLGRAIVDEASARKASSGIVPPAVARTLPGRVEIPDIPAVTDSRRAGFRVTDEGVEVDLQRWQKSEQAGQPTSRGGVFYSPAKFGQGSYQVTPQQADVAYWTKHPNGEISVQIFMENHRGQTIQTDDIVSFGIGDVRKRFGNEVADAIENDPYPEGKIDKPNLVELTAEGGEQGVTGTTLFKRPMVIVGEGGGVGPAVIKRLLGDDMVKELGVEGRKIFGTGEGADVHRTAVRPMMRLMMSYGMEPNDAHKTAQLIADNQVNAGSASFALEEAIAGHLLRKNGYDGAFMQTHNDPNAPIDEIFDAREATYPLEDGSTQLRPEFRTADSAESADAMGIVSGAKGVPPLDHNRQIAWYDTGSDEFTVGEKGEVEHDMISGVRPSGSPMVRVGWNNDRRVIEVASSNSDLPETQWRAVLNKTLGALRENFDDDAEWTVLVDNGRTQETIPLFNYGSPSPDAMGIVAGAQRKRKPTQTPKQFATAGKIDAGKDAVQSYRVSSMLSGTASAIGDVVANSISLPRLYWRTATAAGIEKALGVPMDQRATTFNEIKGINAGIASAWQHAFRAAGDAWLNGGNPIRSEQPKGLFKGPVGVVAEAGGRIRLAADVIIHTLGESIGAHMVAHRQAAREGLRVSDPAYAKRVSQLVQRVTTQLAVPDGQKGHVEEGGTAFSTRGKELAAEARGIARRLIFQNDLTGVRKNVGEVRGGMVGWMVPFYKTIAQVASQGGDSTIGGALALADVAKADLTGEGVYAGKKGHVAARSSNADVLPASQRVADQALGVLVAGTAGTMVATGLLTGTGPSDPTQREAMRKDGWQPLSFVSTDSAGKKHYTPISRLLGPLAYPVAFGAIAMESYQRKGEVDGLEEFVGSLREWAFDESGLRAFQDALGAIRGSRGAGAKQAAYFVTNAATSFVPMSGLLRQVAAATDDTIREPKGFVEAVKAITPQTPLHGVAGAVGLDAVEDFHSKTVSPKLDEFGKPVKRAAGRSGARALLPFQSSEERRPTATRFDGSRSNTQDAQIRRAIAKVQKFERGDADAERPSARDYQLAAQFEGAENPDYDDLKREARERAASRRR